jgi:hypothetical protein
MKETEMEEKKRLLARSVGLVLLGWILGLGCFTGLVVVRATRVSAVDPWMWYLITPIWAFCFCVVAIGTHSLLSDVMHGAIHFITTGVAIAIQCFLFNFPVLLISIYVHLWAGGSL